MVKDVDSIAIGGHVMVPEMGVRRSRKAELQEAGQRFRLLVDNLDDVFWVVDWKTGRQIFVSPAYARHWQLDEKALYASTSRWSENIHPDDRSAVAHAFTSLGEGAVDRDAFAVEYRLTAGNGEQRWIRDRGTALRGADGAIERVVGIAEDITDRRTVIRALREREQGFQLALDAAQLHVWTLHTPTRELHIGESLCAIFGLSPKHGRRLGPWRRRLHPEDRARVEQALRRLIADRQPLREEFRVQRPDGSIFWLDVRAILIPDEDRHGARVHGVAGDVTERKRVEQQLQASERELRVVTTAVPIGMARLDRNLRYRFVNDAHARRLLATTPDKVIGRTMSEVLGESALEVLRSRIDQVLVGWTVDFETPMQLPVGLRYVHVTCVPEYDEGNQVGGFVAMIEDVTERKIAQAKLHQREREFKTLAENAPDVIARVDRELRYLYINRAAESAFGVQREHSAGLRAAELGFPSEYVGATAEAITAAFAGGLEHSASFSVGRIDAPRHFVARAVPEFDHLGLLESVLLIVYDVSERIRVQIERDSLLASEREAREQAEAAARSRDEFLAIVSHELRSPLNGIQSWAQVLDSTLVDAGPATRRAIAGIKIGVEQQVRLIDDLLDATRIISGKLSLSLAPVELAPVLAAAVVSVHRKAADKRIVLATDVETGDASIQGDADRVQQIVWNLLSNAIKFTPAGGHVWLTACCEDNTAVIAVRDDGRGIPADFLPLLFKRFQRDETGNSRSQDGFGLGLMLVRHLCELHRGSVSASSAGPNLGATFTVRLPLDGDARPSALARPVARAQPAPLPGLQGVRLLLVDDHAESRDALAVLLSRAGASVDVLSSGEAAVQHIEQAIPEEQPDVLICDIAMPGQDGYETMRLIRAFERRADRVRLPAIALTAFVQNEDRVRAHNAGFEMHISKPVALEELIVTVAAFARQRAQS